MKFIFTILFSCVFSISYPQSQSITIEGVVKDLEGTPITGVTIRVQHTRGGTSTFPSGRFRLGGVKIGDTLIFTSTSWQKAYFVAERKYNFLNFKLLRDTLKTSIREHEKTSSFVFNGTASSYNKLYRKIDFVETVNSVKEMNGNDENNIFIMVEVNPEFYTSYPKFTDSLASDINKLKSKEKPKKPANLLVYLFIRGDNKIDVNSIVGDVKDDVKAIIEKRFKSITNVRSAIQNGGTVGVLAVAEFEIDIAADKNITIKITNQ